MKNERLHGVTDRLLTMDIGDEWLDPGVTLHDSKVYATARKMKQRYGVAFRAVTVPEGIKVLRIATEDPVKRKPWRGGTLAMRVMAEVNRSLEALPVGGSVWFADGLLADAATHKVAKNLKHYVADREDHGWRIYRLGC